MSKKTTKYKKQRKKPLPWLLLALGGVLVVIAGILFANRSGAGGGTPTIAVDPRQIDYGDVMFGVNKTFSIKVTNTGEGALRFKEDPFIEIVEGC
jgi:hypothetical protein